MALIIAFAVFWIASIIGLFYGYAFFDYLLPNSTFLSVVGVTNFLVAIGVPLIALILMVVRVFFRSHIQPNWRGGLWGFWALNLASLAAIIGFTTKEFQTGREFVQNEWVNISSADTLTVKFGENPYEADWGFIIDDLQISGGELVTEDVFIYVEKSESEFFELDLKTTSRGQDGEEALRLAESVQYETNINGNNLILPPNFLIPKGTKWRNQKVRLYLKVPEGKHVVFEGHTARHIRRMEVDENFDRPWIYSDKGYVWKMTESGMVCPEYIDEMSRAYDVQDFSKIHIDGQIEVNITQGETFEVSLTDKCNCSQYIEIVQIGERLDITAERRIRDATLNIIMPSLEVLDLKNTRTINVRGFKEETMNMWIENRDNLKTKAYIDVGTLTIMQKGNNLLELIGEGDVLKATLESSGDLDAKRYIVKTAHITADNHNDIEVSVRDTLHKNINPSVDLDVSGEPFVVDTNAVKEENQE